MQLELRKLYKIWMCNSSITYEYKTSNNACLDRENSSKKNIIIFNIYVVTIETIF